MTVSHVAGLLARLVDGWPAGPYPPIDELLSVWKERVGPVEVVDRGENFVFMRTSLPESRLRGGGSIFCLFNGGPASEAGTRAESFVRDYGAPSRLLFFFCVSRPAFEAAEREVRCDRCIVWPPEQITAAWSAEEMGEACESFIRGQVPLRMLSPYDITVSAAGPMFFGRRNELARLSQEDAQSFAVTGPGRIGKTSLVKKFKEDLLHKKDPAWNTTYYIDFFECMDRSPDTIARKIAMEMEPGRRAMRTSAADLAGFIEYQNAKAGRKPTLILDEVDDVCSTSLFREQLAAPARNNHCRFILVGRGGLLRFTKDNSIPLSSRLRVLRLSEIDIESAQRLLFEPVHDLGLEFDNFSRIYELVQRQTGCSPHMIQFYGQRMVELAAEQSTRKITAGHVEQLKWDFQTANFFLSPLDDLGSNPVAHMIALALLKSSKDFAAITPVTIQDAARRYELAISHAQAVEVGDTLVIQNILSWMEGGAYRIANEALPEYAGKMGYLTRGLEEARVAAVARAKRAN